MRFLRGFFVFLYFRLNCGILYLYLFNRINSGLKTDFSKRKSKGGKKHEKDGLQKGVRHRNHDGCQEGGARRLREAGGTKSSARFLHSVPVYGKICPVNLPKRDDFSKKICYNKISPGSYKEHTSDCGRKPVCFHTDKGSRVQCGPLFRRFCDQ